MVHKKIRHGSLYVMEVGKPMECKVYEVGKEGGDTKLAFSLGDKRFYFDEFDNIKDVTKNWCKLHLQV